MASYSFVDLKHKTVAELREVAKGIDHEAVKGSTQMNKEHLLVAICKALNIDTRQHHVASGVDKTALKKKIVAFKSKGGEVLKAGDHKKLKIYRRKIHRLKHALRKAAI
jgi:hypothetical protein